MDDNTLKRNLCYHLLFSDVLRWLLNRTDLNGVAKGMVVKHIIALMGAVVESLTIAAMRQLGQGKRNYAKRVEYLHAHEFTDAELRDELMWLWDARSSVHVYEVTNLELDAYEIKDSNRAVAATCKLRDALKEKFIELEFAVIED
jgi:hypothetical protein